jgi:CDP-diacylglycerol--serine O-phosphatidyltransferase
VRALRRREREPIRPLSQLPNLITLLALACGLTAVRFAFSVGDNPRHVGVVLLLMLAAAVLDGIDGRLARALSAQSPMGAQLDSLSDAIAFGVAPAFITYHLVASEPSGRVLTSFAWLAAMVYAGAIALRLARFNVLHEAPAEFPFDREFFVGVPAPAAAWLALTPLICLEAFGEGWWTHPVTSSVWLILVATLAFCRLPTYTFKTVRVRQRYVPLVLLACFVVIAALFTFPYYAALVLLTLYVVHIPFAIRQRRFLVSHPPAWDAVGRERRQMRRERRLEARQAGRHRHRILGRRPHVRRFRRRPRP